MYQPRNITAMEGETVKFNCSSANNALTAFWIIDGIEHDLRDLRRTSTYTFDLLDNSLTINNATKGLDGTAYQCVIDQQASEIGFLTVISKEQFTRSPSRYLRATYIECFSKSCMLANHVTDSECKLVAVC